MAGAAIAAAAAGAAAVGVVDVGFKGGGLGVRRVQLNGRKVGGKGQVRPGRAVAAGLGHAPGGVPLIAPEGVVAGAGGGFTVAVVGEVPLQRAHFVVDSVQALAGVVLIAVILHVAANAVGRAGPTTHVVQHVVLGDLLAVDVGCDRPGHAIACVVAQGAVLVVGTSVALSATQAAATGNGNRTSTNALRVIAWRSSVGYRDVGEKNRTNDSNASARCPLCRP